MPDWLLALLLGVFASVMVYTGVHHGWSWWVSLIWGIVGVYCYLIAIGSYMSEHGNGEDGDPDYD